MSSVTRIETHYLRDLRLSISNLELEVEYSVEQLQRVMAQLNTRSTQLQNLIAMNRDLKLQSLQYQSVVESNVYVKSKNA